MVVRVLLAIAFFVVSLNARAGLMVNTLMPLGFRVSPYVGVSTVYSYNAVRTEGSFTRSFDNFDNIGFNAGIRLHERFGVQMDYTKTHKEFASGSDMKFSDLSFRAIGYAPLIRTSIVNIELLFGGAAANVTAQNKETMVISRLTVPKVFGGIQVAMLNIAAVSLTSDFYVKTQSDVMLPPNAARLSFYYFLF